MEEVTKGLKTITRGSIILFFGILISKFFTFFYRLIVAKYVGAEAYGILTLALSILNFATLFSLFGLMPTVERYVPYYLSKNDFSKVRGVLVTSIKISLLFGIIVTFLIFIFSDEISIKIFKNENLINILRIIIIVLPFFVVYRILISSFYGFKKPEYVALIDYALQSFFLLALTIVLVYFGYGIFGAAIAYTLSYIIALVLSIYIIQKIFPIFMTKYKPQSVFREMLFFSLPLALSSFAGILLSNIDRIMIGYFMTAKDVGIYEAAKNLTTIVGIFPAVIYPVFLPVITELYSKNLMSELSKIVKIISRWILILLLPLVLTLFFYGSQILNITFGYEYSEGGKVLAILSISTIVFFILMSINAMILVVFGVTKINLYISLLMVAVNVYANYLFIPKYGIEGAAIATLLSQILGSIMALIFAYSVSKVVNISKKFINIIFAGILTVIFLNFIVESVIISRDILSILLIFVTMEIFYFILLILLRCFEKEDIEIVRIIINKIVGGS